MNALERLNSYVAGIERALRIFALSRGAAVVAVSALAATLLLVLAANRFAFSETSVSLARLLLFLAVAFALGFGLILPLFRLNRRRAARRAEERNPDLEQRLLTVVEASDQRSDAFLELLAADAIRVVESAGPKSRFAWKPWLVGFGSAAAAALGVLAWLVIAGPGYLGYGAALLWAGPPKAGARPFYDIAVSPGDTTLRRKADQIVTARLIGFEAPRVRFAARYRGSSRWEEASMRPQPGGPGYELLLAGVPETMEYFVEAGAVRSRVYTIQVVDLPGVKRIRLTYRYPQWTGLPVAVEEQGGDIRAVQGTEVEVVVETDRPLDRGVLAFDDGSTMPLEGAGNWRTARLTLRRDGTYHVAAREARTGGQEQLVRLTEDFFIEARKDTPPELRIARPGRDARVSPIEEVTIAVEAADDFGLHDLRLHYSVNGGAEKSIALLGQKGAKEADGSALLYLEEFKLAPGDVVSFYATARDAQNPAKTDIYFLEAQPFEREYSQSQVAGAGGAGGEQDENRISERQKEIIAATWNQIRQRTSDGETARFLAGVQSKLRDQARSLANRMRSRELSLANQEFQTFSQEMEQAAQAMGAASEKLGAVRWQDALQPEQKALQHLLRAEATFRRIQVAFGNRGGGGRGGMGRDLESLFDLELDTEKNQYETGQRASMQERRQRELDEALRRLEQLARRQQELAAQQRAQQSFAQRWQQEILRREAEQLQRRMEQLARGAAGQPDPEGGRASGSPSGERERLRAMGRAGVDPRIQQALDKLAQAARDMARPGSQQRAAEQLQQARDALGGLRSQEAADQVNDMANRAERLASQQQNFAERLRKQYGDPSSLRPERGREGAQALAEEKERMLAELQRLEREMQESVRSLASGQRAASSKLREALGDLQQQEIGLRMKYNAELIRRGMGAYAIMREAPVTAGLQQLRDQLQEAQRALDRNPNGRGGLEQALDQLERARERLAALSRRSAERGEAQRGAAEAQRGSGDGQRGAGEARQGAQPGAAGGQEGRAGVRQQAGGQGPGSWAATNFGEWQPAAPGRGPQTGDSAAAARAFDEAVRALSGLRRAFEQNPELGREVEELIGEMQRVNPHRFPGNPALLERMSAQFLPRLDRIELQVRRQLGQPEAGQARTGASERVPPGYADAVAEYFRRLSKERR